MQDGRLTTTEKVLIGVGATAILAAAAVGTVVMWRRRKPMELTFDGVETVDPAADETPADAP